MNNFCYMKPTKIRSVGAGFVTDENGRCLQVIGSLPIKAGDTVWTDGRIAYGHRPVRPSVKPVFDTGGIPVLGKNLDGYVSKEGKYKDNKWGVANNGNNFFLNNENDIFDVKQLNYVSNTILLDAELSANDNEYFYAGRTQKYNLNIYQNMKFEGEELKSFNSKPQTFDINVCKIIKNKNGGFSSQLIKQLKPEFLTDAFSKEITSRYDRCTLEYFITQVLDFRFIDKNGNFEMIVACFAKGTGEVPGMSNASVPSLETDYSMTFTYLGKSNFIGQDKHSWEITQTASTRLETPSGGGGSVSLTVDINNVFIIARISSSGKSEILQEIFKQPAKTSSYVSGYHIDTWEGKPMGGSFAFAPVFPVFGSPNGSFTYIQNIIVPKGQSVDAGDPAKYFGSAGTSVLVSYDVTCQEIQIERQGYKSDKVDIKKMDNFKIKLNQGYTAECDGFNLYNLSGGKGGVIASEIPSINLSYKIEPYDGNIKQRTMYNGVVEQGTTNDYYGFYCVQDSFNIDGESADDPPKYHMIPHVCVGELKNGYLISASGDKYHKGYLYKSDRNGLQQLDKKSKNIRLNEVRRVRRLKKK